MAEVVITVRGSFDAFHPAERGTVSLHVNFEGPAPDVVQAQVIAGGYAVSSRITPLVDPEHGPVTQWSSDQIRTWAHRPWNNEGQQLPLVHHARISFTAEFSDLNRLGPWVSDVALLDGVSVQGVEWGLTADRRTSLLEQARAAAVLDARDKANAYAVSLGLEDVRPVAIADVGLLGENPSFTGEGPAGFARMSAAASSPELELVPKDVQLSAAVDARFSASS